MKNIDLQNLPQHIAIIMDGNGRWAKKHALGRISGHKEGAESVRETVRTCREIGIKYLTLYAFSVENWLRPGNEVEALMNLMEEYLRSELQELMDNNVRFTTIGDINTLRAPLKKAIREAMEKTSHNIGMILNIALSYGGRDEIINAVNKVLNDQRVGKISFQKISKDQFSSYLDTHFLPDPDLLIRTSGEYRVSNFLLWQMAYTEFYFTDVLWPDFRKDELFKAIAEYQARERRFGLTSDQLQKKR